MYSDEANGDKKKNLCLFINERLVREAAVLLHVVRQGVVTVSSVTLRQEPERRVSKLIDVRNLRGVVESDMTSSSKLSILFEHEVKAISH